MRNLLVGLMALAIYAGLSILVGAILLPDQPAVSQAVLGGTSMLILLGIGFLAENIGAIIRGRL